MSSGPGDNRWRVALSLGSASDNAVFDAALRRSSSIASDIESLTGEVSDHLVLADRHDDQIASLFSQFAR